MLRTVLTKLQRMLSSRAFVNLWSAQWRPFWISLLLTALGGLLFFQGFIVDGLVVGIISVGLDPLRAQFVAALILTAGAACLGGALGLRRSGALVGGAIVFCWAFLLGFLRTQLMPVYDPGGHLEPLNGWALLHTVCVMLGLGVLSAFIGAAVGQAFGEVVCEPLYQLGCLLLAFVRQHRTEVRGERIQREKPLFPRSALRRWLVAGGVVMLVILAANSTDLFIFSPDVGLHGRPVTRNGQGQMVAGTLAASSLISPAMGNRSRPFLIYLPPSYNTPAGRQRAYPVLYLLHGSPGREIDCVTGGKVVESADTLISIGRIPDLIIVFPDGNGYLKMPSEWGNSYNPGQQMETFVANDLVKYVDSHYRTIPDAAHRAIGGLSMGGFGAMNIAVHHPDVFGSVISLGGYYQAEGPVWGTNMTALRLNSPLIDIRTMPSAWHLHVYLGAATKDQPYYNDTMQFTGVLNQLHVAYQFDLEKGYHSWLVWQKQFYNSLIWLKWGDVSPPAQPQQATPSAKA